VGEGSAAEIGDFQGRLWTKGRKFRGTPPAKCLGKGSFSGWASRSDLRPLPGAWKSSLRIFDILDFDDNAGAFIQKVDQLVVELIDLFAVPLFYYLT
jgi:hypothetical protein